MANLFTMFRADAPPAADQPHLLGGIATALAMLALLAVFHQTAGSLLSIWTSSVVFGHGLLIPVIAGYLAYQRRTLVARAPVRPAVGLGGAALALAGIIWLAGHVTGTQLLQHAGLVGMLQSTVLLVLGVRITLALALPLAYLVLAIPFGEGLLPLLQELTAKHTTELLRATGVPVYLADWKMVTPNGAFLVARVCAGLQYILACLAIGGLIAGIWYRTPWKRVVVLAVAIAVPVVANVLRAYGIIMLAHLVSFDAATGVAHVVYGFIFLSVISLGFILLAARFREQGVPAQDDGAARVTGNGNGAGHRRAVSLILAATVAVALAIGIKGTAAALAAPAGATPSATLPAPAPGAAWQPAADRGAWMPSFHERPLTARTWTFASGGAPASVTIAQFPNTDQGSDIIGARLFELSDEDTQVTHRGRVVDAPAMDSGAPAYLRLERRGQPAHLVWYWYAVNGRLTGDPVTAKLYQLLATLRADPASPRLIVLATPANDTDTATLGRLAADLDLARLAAPAPAVTN